MCENADPEQRDSETKAAVTSHVGSETLPFFLTKAKNSFCFLLQMPVFFSNKELQMIVEFVS